MGVGSLFFTQWGTAAPVQDPVQPASSQGTGPLTPTGLSSASSCSRGPGCSGRGAEERPGPEARGQWCRPGPCPRPSFPPGAPDAFWGLGQLRQAEGAGNLTPRLSRGHRTPESSEKLGCAESVGVRSSKDGAAPAQKAGGHPHPCRWCLPTLGTGPGPLGKAPPEASLSPRLVIGGLVPTKDPARRTPGRRIDHVLTGSLGEGAWNLLLGAPAPRPLPPC